jgi:hypothetical protein
MSDNSSNNKANDVLSNQDLVEKLELKDLKALLSHFEEQKG